MFLSCFESGKVGCFLQLVVSAIHIYGDEFSFAYSLWNDERLVVVAFFLQWSEVGIIAFGSQLAGNEIGCSLGLQAVDLDTDLGFAQRFFCKSVARFQRNNHLAHHVLRINLHGCFGRSHIGGLAYQKIGRLIFRTGALVCIHIPRHGIHITYRAGVWIIQIEVGMGGVVFPIGRRGWRPCAVVGIFHVIHMIA